MSAANSTRYLMSTVINSFHYLYQDAEYLMSATKLTSVTGSFQVTRICRSAMLLYILSLEGLVNRALDHFVSIPHHDFFVEREERFQLFDKWKLLFLLVPAPSIEIDAAGYPWSHLAELIRIRNDYVHPKHDRKGYYEFSSVHPETKVPKDMRALNWKDIPDGAGVKEKDLVYGQTKLPKDPYQLTIDHLQTVKQIVDDCVAKADQLLSGRLSENNWVRTEQMTVFFPPGTTFEEIK